MPKYAIMGGYTAEAWARFIENPGDRSEAVEAVGGKLDSILCNPGSESCQSRVR